MKTRLLGITLMLILSLNLLAQDQDYSIIYVYRSRAVVGIEYPVLFNHVKVHTIPMDSRRFLSYKIYSEGKLEIEVMNGYKMSIDVENGKSYYLDGWKFVSEEKGKKDFNKFIDKRPDYYSKIEEDRNYPIIRDNKNLNRTYISEEKKQMENTKTYLPSDIDINIPSSKSIDENKYALIIGNEDYSSYQAGLNSESNVDFAVNDARVMKEYAKSTFGIPEDNIIYLENAKAIEMNRSIKALNTVIKNSNGKADVLFYYAGHGFPEESTNEPYLIPVDVNGTDLQFAVKLHDLYSQLNEYPSTKVTVILDACFSGGGRNEGLVSARGVKIKPKENIFSGNIVVFTASSGEQSSLSYKDKSHGLFTYYLLKKVQETEGDVTYKELSDYLNEQVSIRSALVNQKEQNPQTLISNSVKDSWYYWKIK